MNRVAALLLLLVVGLGDLAHANAFRLGVRGDTAFGIVSPTASAPAPTVTIGTMPYARTVSCGSYTLTGAATDVTSVAWAASPSGASGSCTGTTSWSCVVDVDPDATGEGVETITVTATGAGGTGTDTETIGFYVDGEHSCFLAQSVDGSYNSTLANLDAVATWENLGSSALDVAQGTGTAQPTFRTNIVAGQPIVRCDGGDNLAGASAVGWAYLHDGSGSTVDSSVLMTNTGLNTIAATSTGAGTNRGFGWRTNTTALANYYMSDGTSLRINASSANNVFTANTFNQHTSTLASASTPDMTGYINGTSVVTGSAAAFSASDPSNALRICASGSGANLMTGDVWRVSLYPSELTSTQRGINKAVDEWALGAELPVSPIAYRYDSSSSGSITTAGGSVSSWTSSGSYSLAMAQGTPGQQPASTVSGSSSQVDFDGTNDVVSGTLSTVSNSHLFVVATIDSIGTNGTGASCNVNDGVVGWFTYAGIKLRTSAGVAYAIAHNFDGSHDCAEVTFTLGQKVLLEQRIDGTNVSIAINGGSFTSTTSGATQSASTTLGIGARDASNDYMDGKIHEAVIYLDDLSTAQRSAIVAELQAKWGL